MDARSGYLLEKLPKSEVEDFSLEEVPDRSLPARARRHAGRQQSTPGDAGVADSRDKRRLAEIEARLVP
jgi:hypothetical protein